MKSVHKIFVVYSIIGVIDMLMFITAIKFCFQGNFFAFLITALIWGTLFAAMLAIAVSINRILEFLDRKSKKID